MIDSITIAKAATFGTAPEVLGDLRQFNFIFGSNGTGKTTISRIIADQTLHPDCSVTWKHARPLETVVLNRDFVDKNFAQLRGVFTLGEEQKDTLERIATAKQVLDKEQASIASLKNTLRGENGAAGKQGELVQLEVEFQEKCWAQKQKHDETLQGAFTGYRNSAEKFKEKILDELQTNQATLKPISDLEKRAAIVFGTAPTREASIPTLDTAALLAHESNPILNKRVIGKDDVDVAAMIKKLGNSDWVRQGRTFYEENDQVCPFCQQATTDAFAASLAEYFDETFETDSKAIDTLLSKYSADSSDIQARVGRIIAAPGKWLDTESLKSQKAILDQTIGANQLVLEKKKKEPSQAVELSSLTAVCATIKNLTDAADAQIAEHNRMVDNLATEKRDLTAQVWRFVLNELDADLKSYRSKKENVDKAIGGINDNITKAETRVRDKQNEIRDLEKQTTSIQPTINGINAILSRFGCDNFKLAMGADEKSYRLVRHNGEDVLETLSEGEKTFVVFLYFYHLLRGSMSESGIAIVDHPTLDKVGRGPIIDADGLPVSVLTTTHSELMDLFTELSTPGDLVDYLQAREAFFAKHMMMGITELDLLAFYKGDPDEFRQLVADKDMIMIGEGCWEEFAKLEARQKRAEMDKPSLLVDAIIDKLHEGRHAKLPHVEERRARAGQDTDPAEAYATIATELAKIRRIDRRLIGEGLIEKSQKCIEQKRDRWFANSPMTRENATVVFMVSMSSREERMKMLQMLAMGAMLKCNVNRVVGIATEPVMGGLGFSVDAFMIAGDPEEYKKQIQPDMLEHLLKQFGTPRKPDVTEFGGPSGDALEARKELRP